MRLSWLVIVACWTVWAVLWVAMAFRTKRTAERADGPWLRTLLAVFAVAWVIVVVVARPALEHVLWHWGPATGIVAVALVVAGFTFSVWARVTLGGNWSGLITFKEHHELVQSGPYRLVRHPIYAGLLAMVLGTALNATRPVGLLYAVLLGVVLYAKARREEALMRSHFGDTYDAYSRHTKAIVPFVL